MQKMYLSLILSNIDFDKDRKTVLIFGLELGLFSLDDLFLVHDGFLVNGFEDTLNKDL